MSLREAIGAPPAVLGADECREVFVLLAERDRYREALEGEHSPVRALRDIVKAVEWQEKLGGLTLYPETDLIRYAKEVLAAVGGDPE